MKTAAPKSMSLCRTVLIAFALIAAAAWTSGAHAQYANPFEGMWVIDMQPDSASQRKAAAAFEERISFINGKPVPHLFSQYGFEPVTWTFDFITYQFTVTLKSRVKGTLVWSGKIKSTSNFAGDLVWTRPDGVVWTFAYDARKLPEPIEPIVPPEESVQ